MISLLRRFSVFSLALLLCLSLFPARAFAAVGNASVLWSGSVNGGAQFGSFVKGGTRYDAAVASLGYDSSRLSDQVKAKLSDPSYGGMFYTFANAFSGVGSPTEIPSWVPAFVTTGAFISVFWDGISGDEYPYWYVAVSQTVFDLALADFLSVLNGDDSSGGTVVPEGQFSIYTLSSFATRWDSGIVGNNNFYNAYGAGYSGGVITLTGERRRISPWANSTYYFPSSRGYFSSSVINFANDLLLDGYDVIFWAGLSGTKVNEEWSSTFGGVIYGHDLTMGTYHGNDGGPFTQTRVYGSDLHRVMFDDVSVFYYDSVSPFIFVDGDVSATYDISSPFPIQCFASIVYEPFSPLPPGGDWPGTEPEPAPVAPVLPEPAEPVVETPVTPTVPAPVWPDITINIDNDPTPGTTPSGLDYTELLTRINDNLISIDAFVRAINSNLNSLRSDLLAEFNGVIDSLRNIYNYLLTIDSVLETHCTHLRNKIEQSAVFIANYMRTLIKWLADQLDFDDLTNVEAPDNSLLTTINEKLGGGTYEPNPIKDESAYYEWLDDLWDRFLLGDNWQSSMGSISGSFSELKTRFPFSVPWDIVALFRLFVHDPVTPVFDLPLYFSADGSTPVHVDLSPWDSVASLVRPMIFVIFALKLALLSRDLLGGLGADKGGL